MGREHIKDYIKSPVRVKLKVAYQADNLIPCNMGPVLNTRNTLNGGARQRRVRWPDERDNFSGEL